MPETSKDVVVTIKARNESAAAFRQVSQSAKDVSKDVNSLNTSLSKSFKGVTTEAQGLAGSLSQAGTGVGSFFSKAAAGITAAAAAIYLVNKAFSVIGDTAKDITAIQRSRAVTGIRGPSFLEYWFPRQVAMYENIREALGGPASSATRTYLEERGSAERQLGRTQRELGFKLGDLYRQDVIRGQRGPRYAPFVGREQGFALAEAEAERETARAQLGRIQQQESQIRGRLGGLPNEWRFANQRLVLEKELFGIMQKEPEALAKVEMAQRNVINVQKENLRQTLSSAQATLGMMDPGQRRAVLELTRQMLQGAGPAVPPQTFREPGTGRIVRFRGLPSQWSQEQIGLVGSVFPALAERIAMQQGGMDKNAQEELRLIGQETQRAGKTPLNVDINVPVDVGIQGLEQRLADEITNKAVPKIMSEVEKLIQQLRRTIETGVAANLRSQWAGDAGKFQGGGVH